MTFKLYISDGAGPKTGLSPSWRYLYALDGADKSGSAPTISQIGGGWYKFELSYGVAPWDVTELVGVIDAGGDVPEHHRYIPVAISLRDLAFAFLTNKRQQTISTGLIELLDDDGSTVLVQFTPAESDGKEILTPSGAG
ncbi:MAG: hypothetical protein ACE5K7_04425 [Phycisphaerae bacterium]